jgi:hypothetical protein
MRYVGLQVRWDSNGSLTFDISDYCRGIKTNIKEKPLTFNRANADSLTKLQGDVDSVMLQDIGQIGWISNHALTASFPFSFLSRYARGNNERARRMTRGFTEALASNPPHPMSISKVHLDKLVLLVWTDASLNQTTTDAQLGVLVQLSDELQERKHREIGNFDNIIHFKSSKMRRVARSTSQAELAALSLGVDIATAISHLMTSLGLDIEVKFFVDAQVVIDQLGNPHKAEIYSRLQALFTAQCIADLSAEVIKVTSEEQKADLLTKIIA